MAGYNNAEHLTEDERYKLKQLVSQFEGLIKGKVGVLGLRVKIDVNFS